MKRILLIILGAILLLAITVCVIGGVKELTAVVSTDAYRIYEDDGEFYLEFRWWKERELEKQLDVAVSGSPQFDTLEEMRQAILYNKFSERDLLFIYKVFMRDDSNRIPIIDPTTLYRPVVPDAWGDPVKVIFEGPVYMFHYEPRSANDRWFWITTHERHSKFTESCTSEIVINGATGKVYESQTGMYGSYIFYGESNGGYFNVKLPFYTEEDKETVYNEVLPYCGLEPVNYQGFPLKAVIWIAVGTVAVVLLCVWLMKKKGLLCKKKQVTEQGDSSI